VNADDDADLERRFGGLRRLYGDAAYARLRAACVAVVGLGGVGSWTAEALARSGISRLLLIDLDHIAESNINRQVQALGRTLGQHKGLALRERIADIHPGCEVTVIDAFVEPHSWPALLPHGVALHALVDACDQVRAKVTLAQWALAAGVPLVCVGAAGGKRQPQRVEVEDLADVTHDPLLASLRQRLRKEAGAPRHGRMGLRCVFSREAVSAPVDDGAAACVSDGTLNCHGYGSSVTVTATFGMVAAGAALEQLLAARPLPADVSFGL
jgi:tRNA A37 threonylcarbamoyladenosine dehydratase